MAQSNQSKRVTMQDIAQATGYSINTISHALRRKDDIAPATAKHIRKVAREMGYTVNQLASSLRSGRTRILSVIIGNISNPFYGLLVDIIQDVAATHGYKLMIMCSREDAATELEAVKSAIASRVDGVLLFPTADSAPAIQRLSDASIPYVLMARCLEGEAHDCVVSDDARGACLATRHLIEKGGRRLAFLSNTNIVYACRMRVEGFRRACEEAGIPEADQRICIFDKDEPALPLSERLLKLKGEGFDSLFVFCDEEAWHVLDAIQRTDGLSAADFRIASFDNLGVRLSFPVALCSVGCDYESMALQGFSLLRSRIHGDDRPAQTIVCPMQLVCRGSCAPDASDRHI